MIEVKNLTKKYKSGDGELVVLKNLSFSIPKGQFATITGKSGSGKSTLLYQLGLLDYPTFGEIEINKKNVVKMNNEERTLFRLNKLGYIFQDYALIPELTAFENVLIPLLMMGILKEEARSKALSALEKLSLLDRKDNLPNALSGGQQQRVSIARAIAHTPDIIFADEPTANLDSETSQSVLDAFLDLHKNGQTIVMVTHEEDYAKLSDRIIHLADGSIDRDVINRNK